MDPTSSKGVPLDFFNSVTDLALFLLLPVRHLKENKRREKEEKKEKKKKDKKKKNKKEL